MRAPRSLFVVLLVVLLVAINLAAVLGLAVSRRDVASALREQRALQVEADARAFESALAQLHADLGFLADAGPLGEVAEALRADDPVRRRWTRLDVEAALLLFLQTRPAILRLEFSEPGAGMRILAGVREGAPTLLPPDVPEPRGEWVLGSSWTTSDRGGRLGAWIDPVPVLAATAPGAELLAAVAGGEQGSAVAEAATEPVSSDLWEPALAARLRGSAGDEGVVRTVERLASRFGWTLLLNMSLIPLTLVLAVITLRRARRVARLEAEAAQRDRVRGLEEQVRHAERLASLGRFAAGIAHEINNPLAGMNNYLTLLDEDLGGGRPETARQWVGRLREGLDRTAGTVQQILRFAQPGGSDKRPMDLGDVAERTVAFLSGHPDCRDVTTTVDAEGDLRLQGDPQTLGQVVLNLVLNAAQAQPGGGSVEVVVRGAEDLVELRVRDRGPGFGGDPERAFEPFQSGRGSLGLGLAVCRGIVSDHGGRIEAVDRDDGRGAELRVSLPRETQEETA